MKTTHLVRILGREIPVRSSASEEKVREIEAFVNKRVEEVRSRLAAADPEIVVSLAMLNLAEQYLEQQETQAKAATLGKKVGGMLDKLDKSLETPGLFRET